MDAQTTTEQAGLDKRQILSALRAYRRGDFSVQLPLDMTGTDGAIAEAFNDVVAYNADLAAELARLRRSVGRDGRIGERGKLDNATGKWQQCIDSVNALITDTVQHTAEVSRVVGAVAQGDLTQTMALDIDGRPLKGEFLRIAKTTNSMVDRVSLVSSEVTRVAREVGTEGKLGGQAKVKGVAGTWKDLTDNVNTMAANLTGQVRNIAEVTTAVANGDLSKKITVDVKGEILELKDTINTMVDQLNSFASEVTRVAREVGTEGKLGGQAKVEGVAGTWKDLTDNVNMMATNLTNQVRGIAQVVTAVANGDLERKLTVDAKGEIASLAETMNGMIDTLATFADQVTNVAREVGIEGKLGGQAKVPGASGLWRDLTDNVNQLAANLTTQVRAIAEVATAVAKGDLTRTIAVEALGEVAALKDNVNQMIANLRETTQYNTEQDWLKTNLARFTRLMQGERDLVTVCNLVLSEMAPLVDAQHGVFYVARDESEEFALELMASYAMKERKELLTTIHLREGLVGQCAFEKQRILLTNVPSDYIAIGSGLGAAPPLNIVVLPVLFEDKPLAVIELASFNAFSSTHLLLLEQVVESIGIVLNTIRASMRTEGLLKQSQILTSELQSQQDELKSTNDRLEQQAATLRKSEELLKTQQDELRTKNEELEEKAAQLQAEKRQVEAINREVENARSALEEKASQLALTSKYKSEFLANMSHELRTPLNSLLILSNLLAENAQGNLEEHQIEQAHTIHAAGSDLLRLINDILDLSKIESGTVMLDIGELSFADLRQQTERTFRQVAAEKGIDFELTLDDSLPATLETDELRLKQIVNNLLSNAFKFTEKGSVNMAIRLQDPPTTTSVASLSASDKVIAISISDTGIGIAPEQQQIIFEAFQQADGTTSRSYGGTGLGLSISRELAALLGGEIRLESTAGKGSTFTLYLPLDAKRTEPAPGPQAVAKLSGDADPVVLPPPSLSERARPQPAAAERPRSEKPMVLIVEDDPIFAGILLDIAEDQGFDGLIVAEGRGALSTIKRTRPDAVSLDIQLPDIDGWALLNLLKHDPETRHLPIHIVSVVEDDKWLRSHFGAIDYSGKPASRDTLGAVFARLRDLVGRDERRLLTVTSGKETVDDLAAFSELDGLTIDRVTPAKAAAAVGEQQYDTVLVVAKAPSESLSKLLRQIRRSGPNAKTPVLVALSTDVDGADIEAIEDLGVIALPADRAEGTMTDELARALHLRLDTLPAEARRRIDALRRRDPVLDGRKIAIIDDDVRNIFSLTAILEQHGANVLNAENGREGLTLLAENRDVDAVLVDIMMPEMDGYETMAEIRKDPDFETLPLIAVTAKAMRGDREKCVEVGASDYLAKPVEVNELLAVLRTWLQR